MAKENPRYVAPYNICSLLISEKATNKISVWKEMEEIRL